MRELTERFRKLEGLPRVELAALPTAVERLASASKETGAELWCKRDDLTSAVYGGNKTRKLEWILGDARARGCDSIVTTGAYGSHHVLATGVHGRAHGIEVHAVLAPQPWSEHVEETLRASAATGARLHPVGSFAAVAPRMLTVAAGLKLSGRRPAMVPPGGTSTVGALGYVDAGLELARQIDEGALPEPRAVYVAAGSGGTCVGLAIGLAAAGVTARVVAVRVTARIAVHRARLRGLAKKTVRLLRARDAGFPDVASAAMALLEIDASQAAAGYGVATSERVEAAAKARADGLTLDTTYTAPVFAALWARATAKDESGPLLFVHTLSSVDLTPLLSSAPETPAWAMRST